MPPKKVASAKAPVVATRSSGRITRGKAAANSAAPQPDPKPAASPTKSPPKKAGRQKKEPQDEGDVRPVDPKQAEAHKKTRGRKPAAAVPQEEVDEVPVEPKPAEAPKRARGRKAAAVVPEVEKEVVPVEEKKVEAAKKPRGRKPVEAAPQAELDMVPAEEAPKRTRGRRTAVAPPQEEAETKEVKVHTRTRGRKLASPPPASTEKTAKAQSSPRKPPAVKQMTARGRGRGRGAGRQSSRKEVEDELKTEPVPEQIEPDPEPEPAAEPILGTGTESKAEQVEKTVKESEPEKMETEPVEISDNDRGTSRRRKRDDDKKNDEEKPPTVKPPTTRGRGRGRGRGAGRTLKELPVTGPVPEPEPETETISEPAAEPVIEPEPQPQPGPKSEPEPVSESMAEDVEKLPEEVESEKMEIEPVEAAVNDRGAERKRKREDSLPEEKDKSVEPLEKRHKVIRLDIPTLPPTKGCLMTMGTEEGTGCLGQAIPDQTKVRPALVGLVEDLAVQVVAGSLHTVCLTEVGSVFTFGCNDEGALGRNTKVDGNDSTDMTKDATPGRVPVPTDNVVKVSAGDSHTAALTDKGAVYFWGCFRDGNGKLGLTLGTGEAPVYTPTLASPVEETIVDIASGNHHILFVTDKGIVYSAGAGEQGQLGRLKEEETSKSDPKYREKCLEPKVVSFDHIKPGITIKRVWAGGFSSFAQTVDGDIYVWGLNNCGQLGFRTERVLVPSEHLDRDGERIDREVPMVVWHPKELPFFTQEKTTVVIKMSAGEQHSMALDVDGQVYSCGNHFYGRLGHGSCLKEQLTSFTVIDGLKDEKVVDITCGTISSFAVTDKGHLYSWGMGSFNLGHSMEKNDEGPDIMEPKRVSSKRMDRTSVKAVSAGSQHSAIIAVEKPLGEETNGK